MLGSTPGMADIRSGAVARQVTTHSHERMPHPWYRSLRSIGHSDFQVIPAGGRWAFPPMEGPGAVTAIWMTIAGSGLEALLRWRVPAHRHVWIHVTYDGEETPAISAPLGHFFGNGTTRAVHFDSKFVGATSGGYYCFLPMPFARSCRVEMENRDPRRDISLFFGAITYHQLPELPPGLGSLRAQFRDRSFVDSARIEGTRVPDDPHVILDVSGGPGQYVGMNLTLFPTRTIRSRLVWPYLGFPYLEGNIKVFVDDEVGDPGPPMVDKPVGTPPGPQSIEHSGTTSASPGPDRGGTMGALRLDPDHRDPDVIPDLIQRRIVLMTGKGGVGRTTLTAAMARAAARAGKRVLVAEFGEPDGDYSPLARIFGRDTLPGTPEPLEPGIQGSLLWALEGHSLFLQRALPLPPLIRAAMRSRALRRLFDASPSLHEMGAFHHLLTLIKEERGDGSPEHELILVDMPATGHTLALTGLPEVILGLMPTGPIADLMREGRDMLNDPATGAACVVTLPETLPVSECLELVEGLEDTGTSVGVVLVNKVVQELFDPQEREWLAPLIESERLLGSNRFASSGQTERSLRRLARHTRVPLELVPEFSALGDDLITAVETTLLPPEIP